MKIIVAVKRVIDYNVHVHPNSQGTNVETANVKMAMNPFDEIAVEEALRLKEKNIVDEVIAVSIGQSACQETIRAALAMGADRGIHVKTDIAMQPLAVATVLKALVEQEKAEIVILGKQAIDSDNNQVGQMLAGLLQWGQGCFASKLDFHDGGVSVTREVDGGLETDFLILPAVITTDLRLNEPRYISLPNIVKAKQKQISEIDAEALKLDLTPRVKLVKVTAPTKERRKIKVSSAAELITQLTTDAQVIS